MASKFVLKKGITGKYHFNLVAANGQVIATSEAYDSRASALNGVESRRPAKAPGPSALPPAVLTLTGLPNSLLTSPPTLARPALSKPV